jgi:hypothetical protein
MLRLNGLLSMAKLMVMHRGFDPISKAQQFAINWLGDHKQWCLSVWFGRS